MTYEAADEDRRREQAVERFGTREPACVVCGETSWKVLEQHHIAGRAFSDDEVIVCANCHKGRSDEQKDHPARPDDGEPSILERIGRYLLGIADVGAAIVAKLREYGRALIEAATHCPPPYGYALGSGAG